MSDSSVAGLCRLTVRAPAAALDLAVPSDIPLADLLPAIVGHAGADLPESGLEHGGWALQRIGGAALDPEGTPQSLELRDGEVLLLRPFAETLPPVRFDNLVDGVTSTIRGLPHGWSPTVSRWSLRAVLLAVLTGAVVLLALSGADAGSRAALAAGAALLALAGAGAAGRVLEDPPGAVLLGLATGPFAALAAALAVGGAQPGPRWLAASAAWGVATALALTAVASHAVAFVPGIVLAPAGLIGGGLMTVMGDTGLDGAGAAVAVPAVVFGAFVPMLSFSLAGLRLPPLPGNAEQLREGIEPYASQEVTARTRATDHWMTGLYAAVGVVCALCLAALATRPGTPQLLTGGLLTLLLVLHGRGLGNAWQRLSLVLPGALGAVLLTVCAALAGGARGQLVAVAALLASGVLVAVVAWTVPGRRILPYWGRAGDLLQSAAAVGLLPSVLWVLGVYADLRGIKG
ncbi:type VII secretion integral membrane protein EccD [Streptomyces sp. J2-1]|uniref:type VII secretion integral membrane protein EccD n=1 Tax=Streptomyces corallincola TaxID=2851888 RepID=UPI001C3807F4|nr:type VII secretion integral membrane protein EccD [Streptomyces corallincola]MBV2354903.1 type VII secretion integral membrane protein EccD [Streptomyces corallincola]